MCLTGTAGKRGTNGSKTQNETGKKHQPGWAGAAEPGQNLNPGRGSAHHGLGAAPGAQRIPGLWKTGLGILLEDPPGPCAAFTETLRFSPKGAAGSAAGQGTPSPAHPEFPGRCSTPRWRKERWEQPRDRRFSPSASSRYEREFPPLRTGGFSAREKQPGRKKINLSVEKKTPKNTNPKPKANPFSWLFPRAGQGRGGFSAAPAEPPQRPWVPKSPQILARTGPCGRFGLLGFFLSPSSVFFSFPRAPLPLVNVSALLTVSPPVPQASRGITRSLRACATERNSSSLSTPWPRPPCIRRAAAPITTSK